MTWYVPAGKVPPESSRRSAEGAVESVVAATLSGADRFPTTFSLELEVEDRHRSAGEYC